MVHPFPPHRVEKEASLSGTPVERTCTLCPYGEGGLVCGVCVVCACVCVCVRVRGLCVSMRLFVCERCVCMLCVRVCECVYMYVYVCVYCVCVRACILCVCV